MSFWYWLAQVVLKKTAVKRMVVPEIGELERFQVAKVMFQVIQSSIWSAINDFLLAYCDCFCTVFEILIRICHSLERSHSVIPQWVPGAKLYCCVG